MYRLTLLKSELDQVCHQQAITDRWDTEKLTHVREVIKKVQWTEKTLAFYHKAYANLKEPYSQWGIQNAIGALEDAIRVDKEERDRGRVPKLADTRHDETDLDAVETSVSELNWPYASGEILPAHNLDADPEFDWQPYEMRVLNKRLPGRDGGTTQQGMTFRYLGKGKEEPGGWVLHPSGTIDLFAAYLPDDDPGFRPLTSEKSDGPTIDLDAAYHVLGLGEYPAKYFVGPWKDGEPITGLSKSEAIPLSKTLQGLNGTKVGDAIFRYLGRKTWGRKGLMTVCSFELLRQP